MILKDLSEESISPAHQGQDSKCEIETGWDLGPGTLCCSAAMPAPGQMSPPATEYKEAIRD